MTTEDDFVKAVISVLGAPLENALDDSLEKRMLRKFFKRGFSVTDAAKYCSLTEERGFLDEDSALTKMAVIQKKYPPEDYAV